jgi:hypothetical protein
LTWNFPSIALGRGQGEFHEGIEVLRDADRVRAEAQDVTPIVEVCRKAEIGDATLYSWRKKYAV